MGKKLKLILFVLLPIICLIVAGIPFTLADYPETQIEQTMNGTSAEDTGASKADKSLKGGALYISGGATYTMTGGSVTGKTNQYGGAVYVTNGSTFTMTGGTITGCVALYGGAIYVEAGGTCNITGGTITGNKAQFAPAIYVEDGGVLNVDQTAVIKDNEYEKYGNALEIYVDGSLVETRYLKADTYTINEDEMPLDYEHCCGYFLDEKLSQCSFGEIALTSEAMGFAPRTADAENYVARLYTRTANPDNFKFTFNSTTQTYDIKKKSTTISGHIALPKEYNNVQTSIYSATGYTDGAFYGCSSMTGITFQEGIKTVCNYTFYGLTGLTGDLVIPDSVTSIGNSAFRSCSGFTGSLTIPDNVTSIGEGAFYGLSANMTEIVVSVNNTYYFSDSKNALVEISTGRLIAGCNYTDLTILQDVTSIGQQAFYYCSGLTGSLTIPDSVTSIGDYAFSYCSGLTSVTIGNSVTSIGDYAFSYCSGLTSVTIGDSVTSIGDWAFANCSGLTSVTIGDSVTSIGEGAFCDCSGLTGELIIPDSVTSIGNSAFSLCSGLTGELIIPDSVTSIGTLAFFSCSGLTSVYVTTSVTTISASGYYDAPFRNCSSSLVIYTDVVDASSVPSGWGTYWNYYRSGKTLTVNYGYTLEQYKSAVGLTFAPNEEKISEADVEMIENINAYQVDSSYLKEDVLDKKDYILLKKQEKIA